MDVGQLTSGSGRLFAGRYRITKELGAGAMGWVFAADDAALDGEPVALKVLYPHCLDLNQEFARFSSEVLIARKLSHPQIVQIYGHGATHEGFQYFAMELVEGGSLKELLQSPQYLEWTTERLLLLLYQVARGLAFAHKHGVIHRDLKPHNILLDRDGQAKVADFGIARLAFDRDAGERPTGALAGTPQYMAPEQIRGETADERSDIYAFGITAFEVLFGRLPFQGSSLFQLAQCHLHEPLFFRGPERSLPAWLCTLLERCTAKRREERPASFEEICQVLQEQLQLRNEPDAIVSAHHARSESQSFARGQLDPETARRGRHAFLLFAAFCVASAFLTQQVTWILLGAIPSACIALTFSWKREYRILFYLLASTLIVTLMLRYSPSLHKRAVAVIVYLERTQQTELGALRFLLGTEIPFPTVEALFKAQQENRRSHVWSYIYSGVELNAKNEQGESMLHIASQFGDTKLVGVLLDHGADPSLVDALGLLPLDRAIIWRSYANIQLLLERTNVRCSPQSKSTPPLIATIQGDLTALKLLLDAGILDDPVCKRLHTERKYNLRAQALAQKRFDIVELLERTAAER